ncbi:MAG TPA: hypothetical protein PK629_09530 [Oscillospiraceae bacterium]|nr:hypothetical protein [Oscillospiraceae bacterium]HPF54896.1 hypothetical protein [Clostridiales bacterium]HPK34955.1 hypothetical protein [Oscillospiraceae bacterium]HPR75336.1 hypothetical protein [Oscillospiraceae bacterium]
MLDARQIRDAEFIKNGVKRKAKTEAQQFLERTAATVEQLQNENASVRAENIELNERCVRLKEMNEKLVAEKDELLQKLSETPETPTPVSQPEPEPTKKPDITEEAERIIQVAQDKARLILEQAERDYLVKMNRANAAFTQKTIAFEREFGDNLRKLKAADGELRELKTRLVKLLEEMPDGIGENAAEVLDRLKNQE